VNKQTKIVSRQGMILWRLCIGALGGIPDGI